MKSTVILLFGLMFVLNCSHAQLTQITFSNANEYHPRWKPDEDLMGFTKRTNDDIDIYIMDTNGDNVQELLTSQSGDQAFNWSPDGQKIVLDAYPETGPPCDIYVYDLSTSTLEGVAVSVQSENHPVYSPDGTKIAFLRFSNLWVMSSNGDNQVQLTTGNFDWHPDWHPNGETIIFTSMRGGDQDLWQISATGGTPEPLTTGPDKEDRACWSPDGTKLAFTSDKNGNEDVFIMTPDSQEVTQFTFNNAFDSHPHWSPDGTKIAFASLRNGNFDIFVKDVPLTGTHGLNENQLKLQISPNPFGSITEIKFVAVEAGTASIDIFNSQGRFIKTVLNNHVEAKEHKTQFFTDDLPSGQYMFRLSINGENKSAVGIKNSLYHN